MVKVRTSVATTALEAVSADENKKLPEVEASQTATWLIVSVPVMVNDGELESVRAPPDAADQVTAWRVVTTEVDVAAAGVKTPINVVPDVVALNVS